ncbi:MAG: protein sorting system archaetidylserine synthase [Haloarculaceae archaeon]
MDSLRVRERLGPADVVTLANAAVGLVAGIVAFSDPELAARLVLLAAITDALDGITARKLGGSTVGPLLDSITDVVSFGATPALFVYVVTADSWGWRDAGLTAAPPAEVGIALGVAAFFGVMSIIRTALYTEFVGDDQLRPGIQNTLAATILAAAYLGGFAWVPGILVGTVLLSVAMVAPVAYPKLAHRDAAVMGVVQFGAVVAPTVLDRALPRLLLVAAFAYLFLAPRFYWGRQSS